MSQNQKASQAMEFILCNLVQNYYTALYPPPQVYFDKINSELDT